MLTDAAVERPHCAAHAMAYPNSPGGLRYDLYANMSSLQMASPRAGHANASPYPQMPYLARSAASDRMSLFPDICDGLSSMHISPPFQSHTGHPPTARTTLIDAPIDQKVGRTHYPSGHMDMHNPYYEHHTMPARTAHYQDRKPTTKDAKAEDTSQLSQRDIHQPSSVIGNMPHGVAAASSLLFVKSEDVEPEEMDWFDPNFPESSQIGLQAVLDEQKAHDDEYKKGWAEREVSFEKELARRPNDPTLLKLRERRHALFRELKYYSGFIRHAMIYEWSWREKTRPKKAHRRGHEEICTHINDPVVDPKRMDKLDGGCRALATTRTIGTLTSGHGGLSMVEREDSGRTIRVLECIQRIVWFNFICMDSAKRTASNRPTVRFSGCPIIILLLTVAAVELLPCAAHTMAYPNFPGGLPHYLYSDMSSMHISPPHTGHADTPPYPQAPYIHRADTIGNPPLPPDLYSGISSMQISSPYQSHASLPLDTRGALMRSPVNQKFGGPVDSSSYVDIRQSHHDQGTMSVQTIQTHDRKPMIKGPKVEHASRSSRQPGRKAISVTGKTVQYSPSLGRYKSVKTEELRTSPAELYHPLSPECTRYMEELDREVDTGNAELEKSLERQLALGPNCQNTREILESHRSAMRRAEEMKEVHRFLERRYKEKHPNWRDEF
ncbi:hypothetical protein EVG20_g2937 [Dentipellis fragilis]|uniref:Uncharacterized protein n=1 Tax=Dentipellis fragilis TaxID=205917 RepID=A0A4Y9Z749_9AGAM|nr:hypothetical protein EVG20_g2937 [Dentipellis fragilis]